MELRRRVDPKGDVDLFVIDRARVTELRVLAERFAVIRREDDDGAIAERALTNEPDELGYRLVLEDTAFL